MSIDKDFAPYQESFELKELGFDEPCFGCFNHLDKSEIWTNRIYTNGLTENITAPTFSQAFRWFREKHNLHSNVKCINTTYNNHFRFEIESNGETLYCRNLFDTHEEAELACLKKLIEIVKNK